MPSHASKTSQPKVDCKRGFFRKGWKQLSTFSDGSKCTNTPIKCMVCKVVYWKYGMQEHWVEKHPDVEQPKRIAPQVGGAGGRAGGRADDDDYKQSVFELGGTEVSYMNGLLEKRRRGRS